MHKVTAADKLRYVLAGSVYPSGRKAVFFKNTLSTHAGKRKRFVLEVWVMISYYPIFLAKTSLYERLFFTARNWRPTALWLLTMMTDSFNTVASANGPNRPHVQVLCRLIRTQALCREWSLEISSVLFVPVFLRSKAAGFLWCPSTETYWPVKSQ